MRQALKEIQESITVQIGDRARELERQGRSLLRLQTGDPDFPTPAPIIRAACRALRSGATHYSASRGLPELRRALSQKLERENALNYDPETEILVTHGGIHAVSCALSTLIEPGDEVLILDPCWMPYVSGTLLAGGKPVRVGTDPRDGFRVRADRIEQYITKRTRVLIVNTPCNPTGVALTRSELSRIAALARKHQLMVVADEVYEKLLYDDASHVSLASLPGMRERTVTVFSFSKTFAMTGWRIGYLTAPRDIATQILKLSQYSITNVAPFVQSGALTALVDASVSRSVERMRNAYARRRRRALRLLAQLGIPALRPDGAFYLMIDVSAAQRGSVEFARGLLDSESVSVVPGAGFGRCSEGFIRMTFAASDKTIEEALRRLGRLTERLARRAHG